MKKPDWIEAARVETFLMREHLAPPADRPTLGEAVWVENVPCGPSPRGVQRLREIQEHYGFPHVTTGNASPGATGWVCGVYVREDVLESAPNPLRAYLAGQPQTPGSTGRRFAD